MSNEININEVSPVEEAPLTEVVGICFKDGGKIYYFSPNGTNARVGEFAIVETARGQEYGYVVKGNSQIDEEQIVPPLKPVIRIATKKDT